VLAVGLMSGTSADGIDAAAVEIDADLRRIRVVAHRHTDYAPDLRRRVLGLAGDEPAFTRETALVHGALGDAYADAATALRSALRRSADVIALHGQTVSHLPAQRVTLQLGDAARVAVRCTAPVVADFRSADIAVGGEGAPLVPFADHLLFASRAPVAVLNLGGIANLTLIPSADPADVIAFDAGPANMVGDALAARAGEPYDAGGARAARGRVNEAALQHALAHRFFARRAPKSTGREEFGSAFAEALCADVVAAGGTLDDAIATATALTATSIADALRRETPPGIRWSEVLVGGGGARNVTLLSLLRDAVGVPVRPTDDAGVPAAAREAVAFAILGAYRLRDLPNTLPRCTGARRAVSAGAVHRP